MARRFFLPYCADGSDWEVKNIIMRASDALCEPVHLDPKTAIKVRRVDFRAQGPSAQQFPHFHDACEFIWFRAIKGTLHTEAENHPLASGDIVFIPSMAYHDFSLRRGHWSWVLLYVDPGLVSEVLREGKKAVSGTPAILSIDRVAGSRCGMLFEWLADLGSGEPSQFLRARLTQALLASLFHHVPAAAEDNTLPSSLRSRLRPALDLVAESSVGDLSVETAASKCNLSSQYFSRAFKAEFGVGFADYLRTYRLRQAARALSHSARPISEIAFEHGFRSPSHFTAAFRQLFGVAPTQFRKIEFHQE